MVFLCTPSFLCVAFSISVLVLLTPLSSTAPTIFVCSDLNCSFPLVQSEVNWIPIEAYLRFCHTKTAIFLPETACCWLHRPPCQQKAQNIAPHQQGCNSPSQWQVQLLKRQRRGRWSTGRSGGFYVRQRHDVQLPATPCARHPSSFRSTVGRQQRLQPQRERLWLSGNGGVREAQPTSFAILGLNNAHRAQHRHIISWTHCPGGPPGQESIILQQQVQEEVEKA